MHFSVRLNAAPLKILKIPDDCVQQITHFLSIWGYICPEIQPNYDKTGF